MYYALIGRDSLDSKWELIYGDFNKDVVRDEMFANLGMGWGILKIIETQDDQNSLYDAIATLNS